MEQELHSPTAYDYRQYDQIWRRVAPDLEPYPGLRGQQPPQPAVPASGGGAVQPAGAALARQEGQLPGAFPNPCCMGSAASEMLEVLTGFIEEELDDRRQFLALSRQAPAWARQRLREMAREEGEHARRLLAVCYLITGSCYQPAGGGERVPAGRWCPALRERYHAEACGGFNYARAAEGTTDPCLTKLLNELSAEEYRHAEDLMAFLERALQGTGQRC